MPAVVMSRSGRTHTCGSRAPGHIRLTPSTATRSRYKRGRQHHDITHRQRRSRLDPPQCRSSRRAERGRRPGAGPPRPTTGLRRAPVPQHAGQDQPPTRRLHLHPRLLDATTTHTGLGRRCGHVQHGLAIGHVWATWLRPRCRADPSLNARYFAQVQDPRRPWRRWSYRRVARRFQSSVAPYGYDLFDPPAVHPPADEIARLMVPSRSVSGH